MKLHRRNVSWSAALIAFLFLSPACAPAKPDMAKYVRYYDIHGGSARELRSQMDRLGPKSASGKNFDALTEWNVTWNFRYDRPGMVCVISGVSVEVTATVHLPRWIDETDGPAHVRERWRRYQEALTEHEEGHVALAAGAAHDIEKAIRALKPRADCSGFNEEANEAGNRIVADYRQREIRYDKDTGHGKRTGAVFS